MNVKFIAVTHPSGGMSPEDLMVYCARVSSPANQANLETGGRLLRYCIKNGHWSVFEMADMTVEIETSRAIAAQILRHRSFTFQEFSQRYAKADLGFEDVRPRKQDEKNRQNSTDDLEGCAQFWFEQYLSEIQGKAEEYYQNCLRMGIAKESARFLLPLSTTTRLYMKGSVRSWIHYLQARTHGSTQKEHRDIAELIKLEFKTQFPITHEAVFNDE